MIQFPPEMDENWLRDELVKLGQILGPNWQRMLSCAYTTQLLHSTVEVCWNNKDSYFIWFEFVCRNSGNSFQEVLEAVLFWGWSIPPNAHGWFLCGSPIRVSMTFILAVGLILFALVCIANDVKVWSFNFGGKVENFVRVGSSRVSGSARRNLSPVG